MRLELVGLDEIERDASPRVPMSAPSESPGATTVGDRIAGAVAGRIHARGIAGRGPDFRWKRNSPTTIQAKGRDEPNIDTGQMLSVANVKGVVVSTDSQMSMQYGFGVPDPNDPTTTDREKAVLAHDGQSSQRIKRPFFGMNDGDMDVVAEIAGDEWDARAAGNTGRRGLPGATQAALPPP